MKATIISGTRQKLIDHLHLAISQLEEHGKDAHRISTVTASGGASDLIFEIDPELEARAEYTTHLVVRNIDDPIAGRPETWEPGISLRD